MDKSCQSSADSTTTATTITTSTATSSSNNTSTTTTTNHPTRDQYLRQLNKLSQKISKPIIKKPTFDPSQNQQPPLPLPPPPLQSHSINNHHNQPQPPPQVQAQGQQNLQHQPPVYNINKNDFRDVVQKLTGSPAHDRISTPPPIHQPKPPSSRLQRIRPPPLPQITNRPPPLLNAAIPRPQPPPPTAIPTNPVNVNAVPFNNFSGFGRPVAPLSPLPPFPTVHAPAESPISAYMRDLQNLVSTMDSSSKQFSGFSPLAPLVSPRWNSFAPPPPPPQPQAEQQQSQPQPQPQLPAASQQGIVPSQTPPAVQLQSLFQMPSSPGPFGCLNSPLSSYPLLSPSLLFSPNSGQLGFPQLPLSPTVPVPSPRWRGL